MIRVVRLTISGADNIPSENRAIITVMSNTDDMIRVEKYISQLVRADKMKSVKCISLAY